MAAETAPQVPTGQAAWDAISSRIEAPVFFHKLASAGIAPATDLERAQLWEMGEALYQLHAQEQAQKQASAIGEAYAHLGLALEHEGLTTPQEDRLIKAAAADCVADPETLALLLACQAAQAEAAAA